MIAPTWYPDDRQLRQFAIISLFGFALAALVVRVGFGLEIVPYVLCGVGVLTFIFGLLWPRAVLPVYVALMALALPIGWLISNVLLMALFYGMMTPIAIIFRLMGRDPLRLKRPRVKSYWLGRKESSNTANYYRQA